MNTCGRECKVYMGCQGWGPRSHGGASVSCQMTLGCCSANADDEANDHKDDMGSSLPSESVLVLSMGVYEWNIPINLKLSTWAIVTLQVEQASNFPVVHKLVIHICINGCTYCRSASLCCQRSCSSFQNMQSLSDKARCKSSRHWKRGTGKLTKIFRDNSSPLAHWEVPVVCSLLPAQHQEVLDAV